MILLCIVRKGYGEVRIVFPLFMKAATALHEALISTLKEQTAMAAA